MGIVRGDIVFSRDGRPVEVTSKDARTGEVTLNNDLSEIQAQNLHGIKNGLGPDEKAAFKTILSEVSDSDKHIEIESLVRKIGELKKQNADPRMLRYLESELNFKMTKERYIPKDLLIDSHTLMSY